MNADRRGHMNLQRTVSHIYGLAVANNLLLTSELLLTNNSLLTNDLLLTQIGGGT